MRSVTLFSIALLGFLGCKSQISLNETPPFNVEKATKSSYTGGREESGYGVQLSVFIETEEADSLEFDAMIFRGKTAKPTVVRGAEVIQLVGIFIEGYSIEERGMIMSARKEDEVGNQPPMPLNIAPDLPFELEEDEAVLIYRFGKEGQKYAKIRVTEDKGGRINSSRPEN